MLSNTSSSGEGGAESSQRSGVRKLVKRNNRQSDSQQQQQQQKPKISRLGMKSAGEGDSEVTKRGGVRRLGGDNSKTPESSNVSSVAGGSDSEWSDKNSWTTIPKPDINVADDWNRKSAVEKVDYSWDDNEDTWDDLNVEPVCVKKKMYKCGPVTDEEEPPEPQVFPRLQAPGSSNGPKEETRRFKNPEMRQQEVVEKYDEPVKYQKQETTPKPSFLEKERHQSFKQQQQPRPSGPPPQTSWLRGSWLENVSKSVASLTAHVSQNISAALDTETPPQADDLRQLVAERLKDHQGNPTEESPRKGRKYLHKVGIEDDIRPVYAFQQKTHDTNVPSNAAQVTHTVDNKPQRQANTAPMSKQGTKSTLPSKQSTSITTPVVDESWNENLEGSFEPVVPVVKKSQTTKMQSGVRKGKKLDSKMATQGFLSGEVTQQEIPVQKQVIKVTEALPKALKKVNDEQKSKVVEAAGDCLGSSLLKPAVEKKVDEFDQSRQQLEREKIPLEKDSQKFSQEPIRKGLLPRSENQGTEVQKPDIVSPTVSRNVPQKALETPELVQQVDTDAWDAWSNEDQDVFETKVEEKLSIAQENELENPVESPKVLRNESEVVTQEPEVDAWETWDDDEQPMVPDNSGIVVTNVQNEPENEKLSFAQVVAASEAINQSTEVEEIRKQELEVRKQVPEMITEEQEGGVWDLDDQIVIVESHATSSVPSETLIKALKVKASEPAATVQRKESDVWDNRAKNDHPLVSSEPEDAQKVMTKHQHEPETQETSTDEVAVEPEVTKKDMYKCGHEQDSQESSPKQSFNRPLKIAVNEEQEWNDWDQEMIVEVPAMEEPILTLRTPVTEMHLSSSVKSSTLHSPPYTTNNERVHGARGSICEFEEYVPPLGDMTKQEMEQRIKASLSVEMNKFYEQNSDNEWNESESELVFEDESSERESGFTKGVRKVSREIKVGVITNDWLVEETQKRSNLLNVVNYPVPRKEVFSRVEPDDVFTHQSEDKRAPVNPPESENPEKDVHVAVVEPKVIKKDMYKCGREDEDEPIEPMLLSSATTHVEISPIQEIVEETVEYTTVKVQCFSVPVPAVIPSVAATLEKAPKDTKTQKIPTKVDSDVPEVNPNSKNIPPPPPALMAPLLTVNAPEWVDDDWGSNVSDPGNSTNLSSESESEEEPEVGILESSHPDIRQSTKQKTVEECINLLKQNREQLSKKLEEKKRERECSEEEEEPMIGEREMTFSEWNPFKGEETQKFDIDLESQIIPQRSPFSPEPDNAQRETSAVSWEDDEDELSLVVSSPSKRPEEPLPGLDPFKKEVLENDPKKEELSEDRPDDQELGKVEPIVVSRNMYKCGTPEEEADAFGEEHPFETFEFRKVEGSENKRPEPIGASYEKEVISASPEPEIKPQLQPGTSREAASDWDDWNESEENLDHKNESAGPKGDPWNDNWRDEDEVKVQSEGMKPESGEKEPVDVSVAEAETSNDNDWDDFDAWGEENVADEMEIQVQKKDVIQKTQVFKVPEPPTRPFDFHDEKPIENVFSKLENKNQWTWKSNWGVSLIANASKNVASITAQVSHNLSSALDTGLIPQPEEMAKMVRQDEETSRKRTASESSQRFRKESSAEPPVKTVDAQTLESDDNRSRKSSVESLPESEKRRPKAYLPLTNLVTGVTQISSKVITGGLDTLEGIGKKTFTMIQENVQDADRKGLSDMLHQAKLENSPVEIKPKEKLPQFDIMFDDYQGLVHLEALEILSKQATIKIEMILGKLSGDELTKMQETLQEVEELSTIPNASDVEEGDGSGDQLEDRLLFAVRDLDVEITFSDIQEVCKRINKYLARNGAKADSKEIYEKALDSLAEFTASAVARFHKLAELLSVAEYHSTANEVDALVSLTNIFYWQINNIATRFCKLLNAIEKTDDTNTFITNIFLEASHANSYIEQAFFQFTPISKIGATT